MEGEFMGTRSEVGPYWEMEPWGLPISNQDSGRGYALTSLREVLESINKRK